MSIVTKSGDQGSTALMFQRRVPKCHPRVEAFGAVDELNAALGMARAVAGDGFIREHLQAVQRELVTLMGELATAPEDLQRYVQQGFQRITPELALNLEKVIRQLEAQSISFKGWATPGATLAAAALDVARTVCRRAERRVCSLQQEGQLQNDAIIVYLNRLADLLWLLARRAETDAGAD